MTNNDENQQVFRVWGGSGWVTVRAPKDGAVESARVLRKIADLLDPGPNPFSAEPPKP